MSPLAAAVDEFCLTLYTIQLSPETLHLNRSRQGGAFAEGGN
jgi:hypothetical protein